MSSPVRSSTLLLLACLFILANPSWYDVFLNPFHKDGIAVKIIEALPAGGFVTAPFHAAANNRLHVLQACVAGFGTLVGLVVGGIPGAAAVSLVIATTTITEMIKQNEEILAGRALNVTNNKRAKRETPARNMTLQELAGEALKPIKSEAVFRIFNESHLDIAKGMAAMKWMRANRSDLAGQLLLEAMDEKISQNARQLSAEAGGRKQLKSVHGTYLRANEPEWTVDMVVRNPPKEWEQWYIEDWRGKGKVVLKGRGAPHKPGQFLSANPDGTVDLIRHHPNVAPSVFWKPMKNRNGSWSFLSIHGTFLSAWNNGSVSTVVRCDKWEEFQLENWYF